MHRTVPRAAPYPLIAGLLALALCCATSAAARGMGPDEARHLLARTGFGPSGSEIARFAALERAEAVDRLLADAETEAELPPPVFDDRAPAPSAGNPLS